MQEQHPGGRRLPGPGRQLAAPAALGGHDLRAERPCNFLGVIGGMSVHHNNTGKVTDRTQYCERTAQLTTRIKCGDNYAQLIEDWSGH